MVMSGRDSDDGNENGGGNDRKGFLGRLGDSLTPGRSPARKWSVMGRRGVLKRLAALGATGATLPELSRLAQGATEDPGSEVPYVAGYRVDDVDALRRDGADADVGKETMVETVPRERWVRVKAAQKASRAVTRSLRSSFDAPLVGAGVTTNDAGRKEVLVTRRRPADVDPADLPTDLGAVRDALPDAVSATVGSGRDAATVTDIPVRAEDWSLEFHDFDGEYRPVPGGCKMQGGTGVGTFTQPVYNEDQGRTEMLTAGHVVDDGSDVWQPESNCGLFTCDPTIGTISTHEFNHNDTTIDVDGDGDGDDVLLTSVDGGTCDLDSDVDSTYQLAEADADQYWADVTGIWTWDSIEMAEDDGTSVNLQGYVSGLSFGDIMYTDSANEWFVDTAASQSGDSGGPFYHYEGNSEVTTVGVVSAGVDTDGDDTFDDGTSGNGITKIFDHLNLRFHVGF